MFCALLGHTGERLQDHWSSGFIFYKKNLFIMLTCIMFTCLYNMSLVMRKPAFCICKNKGADQLGGNREADQRLCFLYIDSRIRLLHKFKISSL